MQLKITHHWCALAVAFSLLGSRLISRLPLEAPSCTSWTPPGYFVRFSNPLWYGVNLPIAERTTRPVPPAFLFGLIPLFAPHPFFPHLAGSYNRFTTITFGKDVGMRPGLLEGLYFNLLFLSSTLLCPPFAPYLKHPPHSATPFIFVSFLCS